MANGMAIPGWAGLMLHETALDVPYVQLERDLQRRAPSTVLWFPVTLGDRLHPSHPFNLFVFVQAPVAYGQLRTLTRSPYVDHILMEAGYQPAVFSDRELRRIANRTDGAWHRGDGVVVRRGAFEGLVGRVQAVRLGTVQVRVELHSGSRVLAIPADDLAQG